MNATRGKVDAEAIRQLEQELRMFYENTADAIAATDMVGRIREFNPSFQRMLDYPAEELRSLTWEAITPRRWHALDAQILHDQVLPRGYSDVYQKEFRKKNGTEFPVELRTVLIRDESSQPAGMWVMFRDATERRGNEEAMGRVRLQAWRSDSASRIGAVIALLGHELRQPLAAILNNAQAAVQMLRNDNAVPNEIREILSDIVFDSQRASAVINGMSNRLRRREIRRGEVCLAETIHETLTFLDGEIASQGIHSSFRREADCVVSADKAQIRQVLISLVTNAVEAVQKVQGLKPDLILLDVNLTGVNGIEAATRIRLSWRIVAANTYGPPTAPISSSYFLDEGKVSPPSRRGILDAAFSAPRSSEPENGLCRHTEWLRWRAAA